MVDRVALHSKLQDVPLAKMHVSENVQRELRTARVSYLLAGFDPEQFGYPVVSLRAQVYYVVDGQHRIEAVKRWLGKEWAKQSVTCRVYTGMNEAQEADMFDRLNDQLAVRAFDKFKARVTAKRPVESAVKKIVELNGLRVAHSGESAVDAVSTLVLVHQKYGAEVLNRTLHIAHSSFGDPGLTTAVLGALAMVCHRYNGAINDDDAIAQLRTMHGGVGALLSRGQTLRKQTDQSASTCIAAATVDVLNRKRGAKKLASWWKS